MKNELGYKHEIEIEILTPVAIGNGETMSPLVDYTINPDKPNEALLINSHKLEKTLEENPSLLSEYLSLVDKNKHEQSRNILYDFLKKLPNDINNYIKKKITIVGEGNAVELKSCLKEAGQPFISGSTLKGAIKSALFYNWFEEKNKADDFINDLKECYRRTDNDEKLLKKERDAIIKRKELNLKNNIEKTCNKFLDKITNKRRMSFSNLLFEDFYFNENDVMFFFAKRAHFLKNEKEIPLFIEAIAEYKKSKGSIQLNSKHLTNHPFEIFFTKENLNSLFGKINTYSLANINYELEYICNCYESKESSNLKAYKEYLNKISKKIEKQSKKGHKEAFIPIGFGKSNFYQSIGLSIWNNENHAFNNYYRLYRFKRNNIEKKVIPTRKTIINNKIPLGWIKLKQL
ncbi:MAG: type III-A CRISPR-associated RAMP protein Csm5 [Hyphomicrobiales bacterium]